MDISISKNCGMANTKKKNHVSRLFIYLSLNSFSKPFLFFVGGYFCCMAPSSWEDQPLDDSTKQVYSVCLFWGCCSVLLLIFVCVMFVYVSMDMLFLVGCSYIVSIY